MKSDFSYIKMSTHNTSCCSVDRRDGKIRSLHLPHLHSVKPVVRSHPVAMAIVGLGGVDDVILEERSVLLQFVILEACSNL